MRTRLAGIVVAALCASTVMVAPAHAASDRARTDRWWSAAQLRTGTFDGVAVSGSALVLKDPRRTMAYTDPYGTKKKTSWSYGTWTSPWVKTGFDAKNLIASWSAKAPADTWLRISGRVRDGSTTGSWDVLARWAHRTDGINRASSTAQTDDLASLNVDVLTANGSRTFDGWQVKVDLMRRPGTTKTPKVESVSGAASSYAKRSIATSRTTMTKAKTISVPGLSQMTHRGHYPQWGGGGEAWCSATSMAMILQKWKKGPKASSYSWVKHADGEVDHAARYSYDNRYQGTGNWPFSAAYGGAHGLDSFVTRLYDLREAEAFIKAGIPLVVSVAFKKGELTGAPISSTAGHLLIISGFTADGKVVAHDPAAPRNSSVKRTYSRAQLEKAWLGGSGGVVYVVRPGSKAMPADTARW